MVVGEVYEASCGYSRFSCPLLWWGPLWFPTLLLPTVSALAASTVVFTLPIMLLHAPATLLAEQVLVSLALERDHYRRRELSHYEAASYAYGRYHWHCGHAVYTSHGLQPTCLIVKFSKWTLSCCNPSVGRLSAHGSLALLLCSGKGLPGYPQGLARLPTRSHMKGLLGTHAVAVFCGLLALRSHPHGLICTQLVTKSLMSQRAVRQTLC